MYLPCFYRDFTLITKPYKVGGTISINYHDENDAQQALAATEYTVEQFGELTKPRICIHGDLPSSLSDKREYPVFVQYEAGYTNEAAVPDDQKVALLMMLHNRYLNKGGHALGTAFGPQSYQANEEIDRGLLTKFITHGGIEP